MSSSTDVQAIDAPPDDQPPAAIAAQPRRRWATPRVAAVIALLTLLVAVEWVVLAPTDRTVRGDEASFVLSALSLQGGDLVYDLSDQQRWDALGWDEPPRGLFLQRHDDGWAAAKPIGYSALLAPFLWQFGLDGIRLVGALLLLGYAFWWYLCGRLRWGRSTSAIVAVVASVASHVWFYAFPAHADLWIANLVGIVTYACLRAGLRLEARTFWVACAVAGVLLTEKVPALLALVPLLFAAGSLLRRRDALIGAGTLITTGLISTIPYWYYSDGASWSAYGGERYKAGVLAPWSGGGADDLLRLTTSEKLTPGFVFDRLSSPSGDIPSATLTYFAGRHTGMLTFLPIVPILVAAGIGLLIRRTSWWAARSGERTTLPEGGLESAGSAPDVGPASDLEDRPRAVESQDPPHDPDVGSPSPHAEENRAPSRRSGSTVVAWGAVASLFAYVAFYLVLFTSNYHGGGQSIGNRYFLQFSLVAAAIPVAAGVTERVARTCSAIAAAWALIVLGPLLLRADDMFNELWHTSPAQRLLPLDSTQPGQGWEAPTGDPCPADLWTSMRNYSLTGRGTGTAIRAEPAVDAAGYLVYGPFCELDSGRYLATFEYSATEPDDRVVGVIDVVHSRDPIITVAEQLLPGTGGESSASSLSFDSLLGTQWQFRVRWDGAGSLTVHNVALERVTDR